MSKFAVAMDLKRRDASDARQTSEPPLQLRKKACGILCPKHPDISDKLHVLRTLRNFLFKITFPLADNSGLVDGNQVRVTLAYPWSRLAITHCCDTTNLNLSPDTSTSEHDQHPEKSWESRRPNESLGWQETRSWASVNQR